MLGTEQAWPPLADRQKQGQSRGAINDAISLPDARS